MAPAYHSRIRNWLEPGGLQHSPKAFGQRPNKSICFGKMDSLPDCGHTPDFSNVPKPNIFYDGWIEFGKPLEHSTDMFMVIYRIEWPDINPIDKERSPFKVQYSEQNFCKCRFACVTNWSCWVHCFKRNSYLSHSNRQLQAFHLHLLRD